MRIGGAAPATQRVPLVRIVIGANTYTSKLLFCEHHEEPYRDWATLIFNNNTRTFDNIDLTGVRFRIGYGYGADYSEAPDLWVKEQQMVSRPGKVECHMYCEGQWMYLREQRLMASAGEFAVVGSGTPADPYYSSTFDKTKTVYELIQSVFAAIGWTIGAAPADTNLTTKPVFTFEELPNAADVLMRLIEMTKCFLRPKANLIWEIIYPQASDATSVTYYSNQHPYFHEYTEKFGAVIPNRYIVLAGNPKKEKVWPTPVIVGDSGAYSGAYVEVIEPVMQPTITSQLEANNFASALLSKQTAKRLAGYLVVPHDGRVELYDKPLVSDNRGVV